MDDIYFSGSIIKKQPRDRFHPVRTGRYILATNEIQRLYEAVHRWITNRSPGGIIYGRPRLGKTRAIRFLQYALPQEFGENLSVFVINCQYHGQATENTFFEELLKAVQHADPFSGKASIKRERLYRFLIDKAYASEERKIIIVLDEAQKLTETHYQWLMDIYNVLDYADIDLTFILVGQEQLESQRTAMLSIKKHQIVGRFMVHKFKFTGVKMTEDLQKCLAGYDDESEYPVGSGVSYTQWFFPDQFKSGLRLQLYAEEIMEVFKQTSQASKLISSVGVPMQYITKTIEYILLNYGIEGANVDRISYNMIEDAVLYSGYAETEVYK
ncbi:AAA family ATPase [Bacillus pseudomycoides]|uniref:ATP-binding protein n=1 Tax=Bacillus pseudomycoides TaxID=64104 RepID=UPI000BECEF8F|nr:ATP-binding protein [Bacillus pseudomycoides]MBD5797377.1 AAA family ATPase [Bacillus pseudomycoides]MED1476513.1 ATP-binding protein [Bacillus pseudomycoides]PDZ13430.1 AAA family ATPase [Bacillus pseudomycoides]PEO83577.1 AAA family ATPase [Bacillus pseudomycoides]